MLVANTHNDHLNTSVRAELVIGVLLPGGLKLFWGFSVHWRIIDSELVYG